MNKSVLVADDDKAIRAILVNVLASLGIKDPVEADDGVEALAIFELNEFALVLLDWDMPDKNGLEVLRAIRAKDPEIPVIMVTGESSRERIEEAISAGVTYYLTKPFDQDVLRKKLAEYCRHVGLRVRSKIPRVAHIMKTDVVTIGTDATVSDAVALMLEHEISGLPVVDDGNRLLGIVTEFNLIRSITRPELKGEPVGSVMNTDVLTVTEDTIPLQIVGMMQKHRIRRVPVVRDGEVVGVISRRDLLRYVSENEDDLRQFLDELKSVGVT